MIIFNNIKYMRICSAVIATYNGQEPDIMHFLENSVP